ncbi:acetolactate synthase small subunit [Halorientalis sp. IM1011]|uniref:acetolactate synthase small subunit n=1 Tax=Halorientalis sp. IM1011 TaxID=1932360 RepID=UPI00097CD024|nr:acetolactate synthase small subunit [Halorientalis sp. IM1011]AQL41245.1 acetolactate synthase small subunit [Halorientalis sp. IM1011]
MTGKLPGPGPGERMRPEGRRNEDGIRIDPEAEAKHEPRRAVLSALVEHEPGVLAEVSGLFSRRQFNIESLTVGTTVDESRARMTIVIEETRPGIQQAKKQLRKLIPVVSVRELDHDSIQRELVIVKVNGEEPDKVHAITEMYGGETLDAGPRTITVEITGNEQKIDDAIDAYKQFGIREIVRTGYAALARGEQQTAEVEPEVKLTADSQTPADDD